MTIDETKAAVTVANANYKSSVRDFREAIKPTDKEFATAQEDLRCDIENEDHYGDNSGPITRLDLILTAFDSEERVLDQVVQNRESEGQKEKVATV
jgi:hypothetical protein